MSKDSKTIQLENTLRNILLDNNTIVVNSLMTAVDRDKTKMDTLGFDINEILTIVKSQQSDIKKLYNLNHAIMNILKNQQSNTPEFTEEVNTEPITIESEPTVDIIVLSNERGVIKHPNYNKLINIPEERLVECIIDFIYEVINDKNNSIIDVNNYIKTINGETDDYTNYENLNTLLRYSQIRLTQEVINDIHLEMVKFLLSNIYRDDMFDLLELFE